ncbi:hypothetical protein SELMODRAFT_271496 [Selaginella moellendorffii]|uniref:Uncharacterized protein MST7-1 n=1 Tax=Selaginella moellendorffii TaxID=88036 RepID=D8SDW3_SELML|nr:sugar transport protein 7 [Selaginella moellendorffii]XP_024542377.1 sugar transport protein 7 [Selaginella moellendorffii]EFJ17412.1 hypothetical protein SELMODRAFT_271496 [Selaginella moellendorffii]|eukprot:XP_002981597.1 sugar transport protein 7 [Selaginella moellendorffii]
MAGAAFIGADERASNYEARITIYVVLACIVAASGGLLFGYDIGISGGVTSMDPFLKEFFPVVYRRKHSPTASTDDHYCKYDNQGLAAFTSSLYIAGLIATFGASYTTRVFGRKPTILIGGCAFLIGAGLNAGAVNLAMLIIGRIMLGVGVGFGNQAVPVYLSEMAPPKFRGGLNMLFQLATTLGILIANCVNYGTQNIKPGGWRLSLGLAAVPASLMTFGGLFLPETPNSLVQRGHLKEGKAILEKIRGTTSVEAEYQDLLEASDVAKTVKHPFRNIFKPRSRPQLVMAFFLPAFQLLTGINSILSYAPVLFQSLGFGGSASLYSSVLTGAVIVFASLLTIATVDRWGRRKLFMLGGVLMVVCQVAIAIILAVKYQGQESLSKQNSALVVVLVCFFVLGFGWSWGGLGWLVPSEIFPLETRSAGQSITVAVNLLFTFAIAQCFLAMLCAFKFGIFLFFAAWEAIMTLYVFFLLPETMNVPIEEMINVWRKHWFWKNVVPPASVDREQQLAVK